jgi:hypothetical protein
MLVSNPSDGVLAQRVTHIKARWTETLPIFKSLPSSTRHSLLRRRQSRRASQFQRFPTTTRIHFTTNRHYGQPFTPLLAIRLQHKSNSRRLGTGCPNWRRHSRNLPQHNLQAGLCWCPQGM